MQQIYEFIANKQAISRVFMLFLCCLLLSTPTFAQSSNARITIHKKNISVIEALKEVEKQTKLSVGYNESQLKTNPPSIWRWKRLRWRVLSKKSLKIQDIPIS